MSRSRFAKALLGCLLISGTLDISDALIFYGIRAVSPGVLLRNIARGLLGPSAMTGGVTAAAIGLAIHYFITCCWAALFILLASRLRFLRRHAVVSGCIYGAGIYCVMNLIVLPHTRIPFHGFHPAPVVLVNGVLALVVCMGLPIALITRHFLYTGGQ